ncbi:unnamed protein product [Zymoseptoria tritici ST99CH_1E4]|uniref:Ribonucleases P/MRP subunit Pop8-like domain-containing protein n=1 Tax=Zymoseptoria tritici ST99CH_1E4 TaxID=1276532 RepID=A0A2H1FZU8_ZYMTR|nr:unnamed protein product [Zymoseptoria tritici ST99CH_1E4]
MSKGTPDPSNAQPASEPTTTPTKPAKKRKKSTTTTTADQQSSFCIRHPTHHYLHLTHISPSSSPSSPLDALTVHLHLTAALTTFLGLHGSAIPFDILKLDPERREVWVRIPAEDRAAVAAAVGGWVGGKGESWKMDGRGSSWVVGGEGAEGLFEV